MYWQIHCTQKIKWVYQKVSFCIFCHEKIRICEDFTCLCGVENLPIIFIWIAWFVQVPYLEILRSSDFLKVKWSRKCLNREIQCPFYIFARNYIFQRPFLRGLSMEGSLRSKIDWASLIVGSKFTVFALFYFVFEGNFPSTSPRGAYIWRGNLTEGFLCYRFGGLIFGKAYFWNFMVLSYQWSQN